MLFALEIIENEAKRNHIFGRIGRIKTDFKRIETGFLGVCYEKITIFVPPLCKKERVKKASCKVMQQAIKKGCVGGFYHKNEEVNGWIKELSIPLVYSPAFRTQAFLKAARKMGKRAPCYIKDFLLVGQDGSFFQTIGEVCSPIILETKKIELGQTFARGILEAFGIAVVVVPPNFEKIENVLVFSYEKEMGCKNPCLVFTRLPSKRGEGRVDDYYFMAQKEVLQNLPKEIAQVDYFGALWETEGLSFLLEEKIYALEQDGKKKLLQSFCNQAP